MGHDVISVSQKIVPTGLVELDRLLNYGFRPGNLVTIAARPGRGSTALALHFARHAAFEQGLSVLFFSLEMETEEIYHRIMAAEAMVPMDMLQSGQLGVAERERLSPRMAEISGTSFWIDPSPRLTVDDIRAEADRHKARHSLGLLVIDCVQALAAAHPTGSRPEDVDEMAREVKAIAKDLEVPAIMVSRLSPGPEAQQYVEPTLYDLRERSLEQHSDIVILLHRHPDDSPYADEADLIIAKHRQGPGGRTAVTFERQLSRFTELVPTCS